MVQTLAILLFLLSAAVGIMVIATSLIEDWALMMRALGFAGSGRVAPLPPQIRAVAARQTVTIRFSRYADDRRVAA